METMFIKDYSDGKKNARRIRGCHENVLIQSFEKSPLLMSLAEYHYLPFMTSLIQT